MDRPLSVALQSHIAFAQKQAARIAELEGFVRAERERAGRLADHYKRLEAEVARLRRELVRISDQEDAKPHTAPIDGMCEHPACIAGAALEPK